MESDHIIHTDTEALERIRNAAKEYQESNKGREDATAFALHLAHAVAGTIATTFGENDIVLEPLVAQSFGGVIEDRFFPMPFQLVRSRARNRALGHIKEIVAVGGLEQVDLYHLLDTVNIYDFFTLIAPYIGVDAATLQSLSVGEIRDILLTPGNLLPTDRFRSHAQAMKKENVRKEERTEQEIRALAIMAQLTDATYALALTADPKGIFDAEKLNIYPVSITRFYQDKLALHEGNEKVAAVLTAFNLLKSFRTSSGDLATPLLDQNAEGDPQMTEMLLAKQEAFSRQICNALRLAVTDVYGEDADREIGPIGSYVTGTSLDAHPDIDVTATNIPLNIPYSSLPGIHAWSEINTRKPSNTLLPAIREKIEDGRGIRDIEFIKEVDLRMYILIRHAIAYINQVPGLANARFNFLQSGGEDVIFSINADSEKYGVLSFDMNVTNELQDFALNNTKRFTQYIETVRNAYGNDTAVETLETIRRIKLGLLKQARSLAGGTDDMGSMEYKKYKVPGFLIELLVTSREKPLTYDDFMQLVREGLRATQSNERSDRLGRLSGEYIFDQSRSTNTEEMIHYLLSSPVVSKGGYENLRRFVGLH